MVIMMTMVMMAMVMIMTTKVNTMAVMEATEVVMERMSGRGGLIVNTASLAGASSIIHVVRMEMKKNLDFLESYLLNFFSLSKFLTIINEFTTRHCEFHWKRRPCKLSILCLKTRRGKNNSYDQTRKKGNVFLL